MSESRKPVRPPSRLGGGAQSRKPRRNWQQYLIRWGIFLGSAGLILLGLVIVYALVVAKPNLPDLDTITDYNPKVPLRIYTADNALIGEFGEERRNIIAIEEIPSYLKNAVVAIEDERFYEHGGVDYWGVLRATLANLRGRLAQGASTITMQVARNFFLTNEKSFARKIYEVLLAWKIESNLSKEQILELYMNQIYLGQRAYGFSSAAQIYFGKDIQRISIAEAAMLAGLPKAPSAYNPVVNYRRAKIRQEYILQRMRDLKMITPSQYQSAMAETLHVRGVGREFTTKADFATEMVRQMLISEYGDGIYTQGMTVITTIRKAEQDAAYSAVRKGIMDYELRHKYRGPEGYIKLPDDLTARQRAIDNILSDHPSSDDLLAGVVIAVNPKEIQAVIATGDTVTIKGDDLKLGAVALSDKAQPKQQIKPGAIIRVLPSDGRWILAQMPQVEAAFIGLDANNGGIRALVGGFDFNRNKYNRVSQAQRQPGSSFKPFIYAAALEKGIMPNTLVNDAPLSISSLETGSQMWSPKNYDGKFEGQMKLRAALAKSKNLVSVRVIRKIGPRYAQDFIQRFGFEAEKHPPYLTMALGAGSVTPLELATGYGVFANGGYRVEPYLISKVIDAKGNVLFEATPQKAGDPNLRALDARTAFVMDSLLQEVTKTGTAASARPALGRSDIAGKTGTTNESMDAWFAGYQSDVVAVAWMGFDKPKSLGDRETGGGLALPMWIRYMKTALNGVPESPRPVPAGVAQQDGDWTIPAFVPFFGRTTTLD
ncbi:penicillin-binding protein 1A [Polynucleobacter sp. AM-26B4]|jgi:penicillin-binding protein 1A|uniref:penicillin-binding protein 1A n=1 Tax=Polynucleobacter sp. AM-26B4 TaxID=2689103 RepID=UPI001C0E1B3F|nr:penicillin-binding protein 1A [Polynucleobacter sp. AM-26B4]MBU3585330.1 penicillin-binding protein 1A [Polynucleobacter sp. AM-26B4]